jgi:hypothetical protein
MTPIKKYEQESGPFWSRSLLLRGDGGEFTIGLYADSSERLELAHETEERVDLELAVRAADEYDARILADQGAMWEPPAAKYDPQIMEEDF